MGQRFILTEQEKNRIKSLYEIKNVSPPYEYVVVAKVNPFKDSTYEIARQKYNPNLKDGDLFYFIYTDTLKEDLIQKNIKPNLINKNVRIPKIDEIKTIVDAKASFNSKNELDYIKIIFSSRLPYPISSGSYRNSDEFNFFLLGAVEGEFGAFVQNPETFFSYLQPYVIELINKTNKEFNSYLKDLSTIPDKYFEIRKIQRRKTDF